MHGAAACTGVAGRHFAADVSAVEQEWDHALHAVVICGIVQGKAAVAGNCIKARLARLQKLGHNAEALGRCSAVAGMNTGVVAYVDGSASGKQQLDAGHSSNSASARESRQAVEVLNINIGAQGNEGHDVCAVVLKACSVDSSVAASIAGSVDINTAVGSPDYRCIVLKEVGQARFFQIQHRFHVQFGMACNLFLRRFGRGLGGCSAAGARGGALGSFGGRGRPRRFFLIFGGRGSRGSFARPAMGSG